MYPVFEIYKNGLDEFVFRFRKQFNKKKDAENYAKKRASEYDHNSEFVIMQQVEAYKKVPAEVEKTNDNA